MEEQAEDLQYRLNDLQEKGDVVINIEDEWWTTESKTCSLLQSFDPKILTFAKATEIAFDQGCIYNLSPPFSPQKALLLLDFFTTQAQTNVLLARQQKLAIPPTIGGTSKNFRQNLIRMIDLLSSSSSSPATKSTRKEMPTNIIDLIKCLNAEVAQVKQKPANKGDYLVDKTSMSDQEMTSVREIMKDMNADFSMRKKTALQRLDLTLQSFMWSPNAEGKEEEIIAVLRPLVAQLHSTSFNVTENQLFTETLTSINVPSRKRRGAAVRAVVVGNVPDRGGRVEDVKPRDLQPVWAKRRSGGGGGRG